MIDFRRYQGKQSGFTIVELLIVIVVIGILAAITIVAYNGIQQRAQASAIVSDLRAAEKAFHSYKAATGASVWWVDNDPALAGTSNSPISTIIANQPVFREFLQKAPTTTGLDTIYSWAYDADDDTYNGCSNTLTGVNIGINGTNNPSLVQTVDSMIDDGNLNCGKMRMSSTWLLYAIANSPTS